MSETMFGRIERGRMANVTVRQLAVACAAVGLKYAGRPYLDGDPLRDAGHARLLERLHRELPNGVIWRTEVPVSSEPADHRAWDGQCLIERLLIGVEAETRLFDLQALDRRIALKRRDAGLSLVILLVADTATNRRVLAAHRESLRSSFRLDTRQVLKALRRGQAPTDSGIVLL